MGLESASESAIKTAFKAVTDLYDPADRPAYRCFFLDDREGAEREERTFPQIRITASPNIPSEHGSTFRDVRVRVEWATHASDGEPYSGLRSLYEDTRAVLDDYSLVTVVGYNLTGLIIEDSDEPEIDDNEQMLAVTCTVKVCGA